MANEYVAYCFHSVEGYSKIGSYDGNSRNADGTFVYTGFKPAYGIMIKGTASVKSMELCMTIKEIHIMLRNPRC